MALRRGPLPSAASTWAHRRRALLGNSTAAVQPLYGSVRDNGVFTVHVALCTPAQTFDMIVDTGSTGGRIPSLQGLVMRLLAHATNASVAKSTQETTRRHPHNFNSHNPPRVRCFLLTAASPAPLTSA